MCNFTIKCTFPECNRFSDQPLCEVHRFMTERDLREFERPEPETDDLAPPCEPKDNERLIVAWPSFVVICFGCWALVAGIIRDLSKLRDLTALCMVPLLVLFFMIAVGSFHRSIARAINSKDDPMDTAKGAAADQQWDEAWGHAGTAAAGSLSPLHVARLTCLLLGFGFIASAAIHLYSSATHLF